MADHSVYDRCPEPGSSSTGRWGGGSMVGKGHRRPLGPAHERLGGRLRDLRDLRGLPLRALSRYSPSHLSQVEHGIVTPSEDLVAYLVDVLGGSQREFAALLAAAVAESRARNAELRRRRRGTAPVAPIVDPPASDPPVTGAPAAHPPATGAPVSAVPAVPPGPAAPGDPTAARPPAAARNQGAPDDPAGSAAAGGGPPRGGAADRTTGQSGEFWAGDVLVIGAGASGLLIAAELRRAGYEVTLLDADGMGAAQSNHSHGYLHRGHIYIAPSASLVRALGSGADRWHQLLGEAALTPHAARSTVGFTNAYTAAVAEAAWRAAGLTVTPAQPPPGGAPAAFARCYATEEATYVMTPWFGRFARRHLAGVATVHGRATELLRTGTAVTGVRVLPARAAGARPAGGAAAGAGGGAAVTLRARCYVLAAGIGNLPLISSATSYRGRALNRTSFMLVLRATGLGNLSLVMPEHETYGLFMVSRHVDGSDVWLVSNYLSYAAESCSAQAATMWLRATVRRLRRLTSALAADGLRWGVYCAPKGELRADRNRLDVHSVQDYGLTNVLVAAPTKLTLCPLLADDVARAARERLATADVQSRGDDRWALARPLPVRGERWESVALAPADDLHRLVHDPRRQLAGWSA